MSRAWLVVWVWCWLGWAAEPVSGADAAQREHARDHVERNPTGAEVRRVRFQIPQTTAKDALVLFAQQAQTPLLVSFELVATVQANPLVGEFSLAEGLDRLLAGSGLQGNVNEQGVINVIQATSSGKKPELRAATNEEPDMRETPNRGILARIALAFTALVAGAGQASAEDEVQHRADNRVIEEIHVTARKREESLQETPVLITAFSREQIRQHNINSLDELAQFTPGLQTGEQTASNGGSVFLRGIGNGNVVALADSSIAINIDGMQVASNNIRKVSQIDMQQIEVLRGPQALFFGKNSPAGVIYITTADPADEFEAETSVGYELESDDRFVRAIVSGPLSDRLGARLVAQFTDAEGYFNIKNVDGGGNPLVQPASIRKWPGGEEAYARATVLAEPSDQLTIRAKLHYSKSDINGGSATALQRIECPTGAPRGFQVPFPCKRGSRDVYIGGADPAVVARDPTALTLDAIGFRRNTQHLGTLEVNYELDSPLTFTSVTGYWEVDEDNAQNPSAGALATVLVSNATFEATQLTQEFRLASAFDSMVNFTLGAFGERRDIGEGNSALLTVFNLPFPLSFLEEEQQALSVFGQVEADLNEQWTLAAGARYTREEKDIRVLFAGADFTANMMKPKDEWKNVSPEVTLSFRPLDDLTLFASYKEGFKSGGIYPGRAALVAASSVGAFVNGFDEEVVTGFELGAKAVLRGGTLAVNLAAYSFEYDDLQVSSPTGDVAAGTISFRTTNAASADVRGIEVDFTWLPPTNGLTLRGALAYNDASYGEFLSQCYAAQSIAAGCNLLPNGNGVFQQQDLGGRTLSNAPKWTGSLMLSYDRQLGEALRLNGSVSMTYSDSYFGDAELNPQDRQDSFSKTHASLTLTTSDGRWEVSLVGRNLTDEYTYVVTAPALFTAGPSGTASPPQGDLTGFPSRGREVFLTAAFRWR